MVLHVPWRSLRKLNEAIFRPTRGCSRLGQGSACEHLITILQFLLK
jgi:hypothetical protein